MLNDWFIANNPALKAKMDKEDFRLLHFYINNAVNGIQYLIKQSASIAEKTNTANLFRDSVMAQNIKHISNNQRSVVWAHNAHVLRTASTYMGNYLNQYFKSRYYVIATDFSKFAAVDVNNQDTTANGNKRYITKIFKSGPSTAAFRLLEKQGIAEGVFFRNELIKMNAGEDTNVIDANGFHLFINNSPNGFDALVVFSNIYPTAK